MGVSLPLVDPRAGEIIRLIGELEASVEAAEPALVARDWKFIEERLSEQHRLTHAVANLLAETHDIRPAAFTAELDRRVERIKERRDTQLRRLMAFNHAVKSRLSMIARSREMRRVHVSSRPPARIIDTIK